MMIQFIKKQWIHTQILESGVRPYPHNGLVCSSHLGGGTKTQEVPYTGRAQLTDSLADLKRRSVPHWCVFTRVGTRKSKGESAQRCGLFSWKPAFPGESPSVLCPLQPGSADTLTSVSVTTFLLWFIQERGEDHILGNYRLQTCPLVAQKREAIKCAG